MRRFQKIDVNEPSLEDTIEIMKGLKPYYEEFHGLRYSNDAVKAAVELSARYINDRKLPDKAIDVLDETGASQMLLPGKIKRKKTISVKEIEATIASMARIPPKSVSKDDAAVLENLDTELKSVVYGQDAAIGALASAIKLARAGLREPDKPIGSYLFAGPTGVGKTEVAASWPRRSVWNSCASTCRNIWSVIRSSRLIGAPPGYVGFDRAVFLRTASTSIPIACSLLDEIEKAHPDLFNILPAGDGPRQAHGSQTASRSISVTSF